MKLIIFGILQFVLWTAFYTTVGLLKDERTIIAALSLMVVSAVTMLAMVVREDKK